MANEAAGHLGKGPEHRGNGALSEALGGEPALARIGPNYRPIHRNNMETDAVLLKRWGINNENGTSHMARLAAKLAEEADHQMSIAIRMCQGPHRNSSAWLGARALAIHNADKARSCLSCLHRLSEFSDFCAEVRTGDDVACSGFVPTLHTRFLAVVAQEFLVGKSAKDVAKLIREMCCSDDDAPPPEGDPDADQT